VTTRRQQTPVKATVNVTMLVMAYDEKEALEVAEHRMKQGLWRFLYPEEGEETRFTIECRGQRKTAMVG